MIEAIALPGDMYLRDRLEGFGLRTSEERPLMPAGHMETRSIPERVRLYLEEVDWEDPADLSKVRTAFRDSLARVYRPHPSQIHERVKKRLVEFQELFREA